ncbi:MAG: peptidylprolyl isomerase [Nitrospinota bacterium]|nr:peptidylprolyl isomerase [Nitrospinota bacterium]
MNIRITRLQLAIFTITFLSGLCMGCESGGSDEKGEATDVVVVVNKEEITREDFQNELKWSKRKYRVRKNDVVEPNQETWLKMNTLNELIQESLLRQEAIRQGIKVTSAEFEKYLDQNKEGYKEDTFERALEIEEISRYQWDEKLKANLLIRKLTEEVINRKIEIPEKDMLDYFNNNKEEFQKGEQVRTLHIMVETEDEARRILKMVQKGKSFSDLAKEHSLGLEGKSGGDMGYFEAGQMQKEFDGVFELDVGSVSDIIQTPYGFHIFKVVDKKPERNMNFEESQKQIHAKLLHEAQEKAFQKWVDEIRQKAEIIIKYEILDSI